MTRPAARMPWLVAAALLPLGAGVPASARPADVSVPARTARSGGPAAAQVPLARSVQIPDGDEAVTGTGDTARYHPRVGVAAARVRRDRPREPLTAQRGGRLRAGARCRPRFPDLPCARVQASTQAPGRGPLG